VKRAYCSECGAYVILDANEVCPGGHPRPCYRDICEVDVNGNPVSLTATPPAGVLTEAASPVAAPYQPELALPPVSGFWRRLGAFVLDGLVLGVIGQMLGWALSPLWFQFGPYGRFVGVFLALPYFAIMDSSVGGGRTLGKRLAGVVLAGEDGEPIGFWRSLLRTSIWLVPSTLNGWALPILANPVLTWLSTVIIFGVGGALVFTMIFNRQARQGLHDMLCKTYVVRPAGPLIAAFPQTPRGEWVASMAIVGIGLVFATAAPFVAFTPGVGERLAPIMPLYTSLNTDKRFFSASVNDQTFYSGKSARHALLIGVWYKGRPSDAEAKSTIDELANVALLRVEDVDQYDMIRVVVNSAFDLGVASGHISIGDGETPADWRKRLDLPAAK
jgi:uncharacterized RDD family membrane protein YckC